MQDVTDAVDTYLMIRFGFGLKQLLADATAGHRRPDLTDSVTVVCDPVGSFAYDHGGISRLYHGLLTIEGVIYRFRCSISTDAGGAHFLESVGELAIVPWGVRLVVPLGAGMLTGGTSPAEAAKNAANPPTASEAGAQSLVPR
jgi:hypothetical protein